jgi:hypothetical protein
MRGAWGRFVTGGPIRYLAFHPGPGVVERNELYDATSVVVHGEDGILTNSAISALGERQISCSAGTTKDWR